MLRTIRELGIVPFFVGPVPGFSIEEMTPQQMWFHDDFLGPWDWKIPVIQSGEIAYGKFISGGKSCFATVKWYRELMNWRRSQPKYAPEGPEKEVLDYVEENGSISIKEVRSLLGVKKNKADAVITRLQMATRLVTGNITRVYRGADMHYNGWQTSSFCTPEALFGIGEGQKEKSGAEDAFSHTFKDFPFASEAAVSEKKRSPEESLHQIENHLRELVPEITPAQLNRLLR